MHQEQRLRLSNEMAIRRMVQPKRTIGPGVFWEEKDSLPEVLLAEPLDIAAPIREPFRALPKWAQWIVGPMVIWSCMHEMANSVEPPRPGEPLKAFWVQLIILVVSVVLGELLRPKPAFENARPSPLGDFKFPTATEGRPVTLIWGKVRTRAPNVVWYGDKSERAITKSVKSGMFSRKRVTIGFEYFIGVQMALGRGPEMSLWTTWIGEDVVFGSPSPPLTLDGAKLTIDKPKLFGGTDAGGTGGVQTTCDFYTGSRTQSVNAFLDDPNRQQITTAATPTAPRYTGTCHLVARALEGSTNLALGHEGAYLGNSTTVKPWSFELSRFPELFSGQNFTDRIINDDDANPVNVIYEILTNDEFGFGESPADIDIGVGSSFNRASDSMVD